jgi:hypothetical protein
MTYPQVNSALVKLTDQERTLLQRVYKGYDRVLVEKEFSGGYSDTRVLLVLPIESSGRKAAYQVTKLGPVPELCRERDNYDRYVKDSLPFCTAQVREYQDLGDEGALNYVFVGDGALGRVIELEEYYREHSIEQVEETLNSLLDEELGQRWYYQASPLYCFFAAEYGRHLVEHLRLKLRPKSDDALWSVGQSPAALPAYRKIQVNAIVHEYKTVQADTLLSIEGLIVKRLKRNEVRLEDPDSQGTIVCAEFAPESEVVQKLELGMRVGVRGKVIHNRHGQMERIVRERFPSLLGRVGDERIELFGVPGKYPNPLSVYPKVLSKMLDGGRSYVHGDLHLRNVLVDKGGRGWLIDFARVEERHNLFDFIELETYVRLMGLAGDEITFSHGEYIQLEKALADAALGSKQGTTCPNNPQLERAYQVILAIRRIAQKYMSKKSGAFLAEYFPALFLYCLAMLKYYQNDKPQQTQAVFITACVLSCYLFGISDGLHPKTPSKGKGPESMKNITYLRRCLVESFANVGEIYDFCEDYLDGKEIIPQLPANAGIIDLVRKIIAYCKAREQLDILYDFLAKERPRRYRRYYRDYGAEFDSKNRLKSF